MIRLKTKIKYIMFLVYCVGFIKNTNAQNVRVIDNKGTIKTVRNNNVTFTGSTAPANPVEGDVWINSDTGITQVYDSTLDPEIWRTIGDNLGNHTATQNIKTNGNWISNDGTNNGMFTLNNGRVGFGTNDPQAEIHVNHGGVRFDRTSDPAYLMLHRKNETGTALKSFLLGVKARVGSGEFYIGDMSSDTSVDASIIRFLISTDGNVGIQNTNPNVLLDVNGSIEYAGALTNVADISLQENIIPITTTISDKIENLNPVSYQFSMGGANYDFTDETRFGFVAQEVEAIFPELVGDNGDGLKTLNYIDLIALLTKANQEQEAQINRLNILIEHFEERLETAENEIDIIKNSNEQTVYTGYFFIGAPGSGQPTLKFTRTQRGIPFKPSQIKFIAQANSESFPISDRDSNTSSNTDNIQNSLGTMHGFANSNGGSINQAVIYTGLNGASTNSISRYTSNSGCIGLRYSNSNGSSYGTITGVLSSFNNDGFSIDFEYKPDGAGISLLDENVIVMFTAYK